MKKLFFVIAMLFLFIGCGSSEPVESWTKFSSTEGGFSALMPESPTVEDQFVPTAVGSITAHMFSVDQSTVTYAIAYADYPAMIVEQVSAESLLESARDGALANVKGSLEKEAKVYFGTDPAREFWFKVKIRNQAGYGHAVVLLKDARLYQMMVIGLEGLFPAQKAQKFLDSIDIWD